MCSVYCIKGSLPLGRAALAHGLCQLCYLRNRATVPDYQLSCWRADDPSSSMVSELEYYTVDYPSMTLVTWSDYDGSTACAHLCELAPDTTGYNDLL